jgi:hypothetical protein
MDANLKSSDDFLPQKKINLSFEDKKLLNIIDKLVIKYRCLEFEVRKLKEAVIILDAKIHKKQSNYFEYSTDDEDEHFYLDYINGV